MYARKDVEGYECNWCDELCEIFGPKVPLFFHHKNERGEILFNLRLPRQAINLTVNRWRTQRNRNCPPCSHCAVLYTTTKVQSINFFSTFITELISSN